VTWLIHMCDMTHSYVWHDSCVSQSTAHEWVSPSFYEFDLMCVVHILINSTQSVCTSLMNSAECMCTFYWFQLNMCAHIFMNSTRCMRYTSSWIQIKVCAHFYEFNSIGVHNFMNSNQCVCTSLWIQFNVCEPSDESDSKCSSLIYSIQCVCTSYYGVATMSRLLKIIGLFCKRAL